MSNSPSIIEPENFEQVVSHYFEALYRFAFSLTRAEADASDLTQQTFYIWATKRHQIRDCSKVKSWLFTTLHREFMRLRKRSVKFPHFELSETIDELPDSPPESANRIDSSKAVEMLGKVPEPYRAAVTLFYMEDYSYKEIAGILGIPIGTVRSRISRGISYLQQKIVEADKSQVENDSPRPPVTQRTPSANRDSESSFYTCVAIPSLS